MVIILWNQSLFLFEHVYERNTHILYPHAAGHVHTGILIGLMCSATFRVHGKGKRAALEVGQVL